MKGKDESYSTMQVWGNMGINILAPTVCIGKVKIIQYPVHIHPWINGFE